MRGGRFRVPANAEGFVQEGTDLGQHGAKVA